MQRNGSPSANRCAASRKDDDDLLKLRVVWVSFAPLEKSAGGPTSPVASVRYRVTIPAAAVGAEGVESKVTHFGPGANRRTLLERFEGADAVVFGKLLAQPDGFARAAEQALDLVAQLRARGVVVLADYSDDHFADVKFGPAYRALANAVDRVVASTVGLADVISEQTPVPVSVITDPVEGARAEPRMPGQPPYSLLWFGHPVNLDTLQYGLPQLERVAARIPYSLTLMTAPGAGAEQLASKLPGRFRAWSTKALFEELRCCDAVVIPSNAYDPRKAVKSPNRFTEALWGGCFVIAHALPAYQELADYGWVGEDLGTGLSWFATHAGDTQERIRRGQTAITARFTPQAVAESWKAAILRTMGRS
jgi:glycosyltransferase involved in cell wall biosynthesis